MITRKTFLKQMSVASAGIGLCGLRPVTTYGGTGGTDTIITIMHTNDTHSRIQPFPAGSGDFSGLGGVARRATVIRKIREQRPLNLLLDAGDTFQGTPYFNFYKGALDFRLMSMMGYDASTIGNHEFDNRVQGFVDVAPKAQFPFVISNYDFRGAPDMAQFTLDHIFKSMDGVRIGIFGLGVGFANLVLPELHVGVTYLDPVETAERRVRLLRDTYGCEMVICLSHLGFEYATDQVSDKVVASAVDGIDLIIGGHTHTLLEEPFLLEKPGQRPTIISQVGHAGVVLGRLDFTFTRTGKMARVSAVNQRVG